MKEQRSAVILCNVAKQRFTTQKTPVFISHNFLHHLALGVYRRSPGKAEVFCQCCFCKFTSQPDVFLRASRVVYIVLHISCFAAVISWEYAWCVRHRYWAQTHWWLVLWRYYCVRCMMSCFSGAIQKSNLQIQSAFSWRWGTSARIWLDSRFTWPGVVNKLTLGHHGLVPFSYIHKRPFSLTLTTSYYR